MEALYPENLFVDEDGTSPEFPTVYSIPGEGSSSVWGSQSYL